MDKCRLDLQSKLQQPQRLQEMSKEIPTSPGPWMRWGLSCLRCWVGWPRLSNKEAQIARARPLRMGWKGTFRTLAWRLRRTSVEGDLWWVIGPWLQWSRSWLEPLAARLRAEEARRVVPGGIMRLPDAPPQHTMAGDWTAGACAGAPQLPTVVGSGP